MFAVVIDERSRSEVARVRAYSEDPRNYYRAGGRPAAKDDGHVCVVGIQPYGVVACYTVSFGTALDGRERLYRHLSLAFIKLGLPTVVDPVLAAEVVRLFGFSGGLSDWQWEADPHDRFRIILLQPYVPPPAVC